MQNNNTRRNLHTTGRNPGARNTTAVVAGNTKTAVAGSVKSKQIESYKAKMPEGSETKFSTIASKSVFEDSGNATLSINYNKLIELVESGVLKVTAKGYINGLRVFEPYDDSKSAQS